jgi:hypothetical protein
MVVDPGEYGADLVSCDIGGLDNRPRSSLDRRIPCIELLSFTFGFADGRTASVFAPSSAARLGGV